MVARAACSKGAGGNPLGRTKPCELVKLYPLNLFGNTHYIFGQSGTHG